MRRIFLLLFLFIHVAATDPFVVWTPVKAGTHLISAICDGLVDGEVEVRPLHRALGPDPIGVAMRASAKGGTVISHDWKAHRIAPLLRRGFKILFLLRDPRDHLISMLYWINTYRTDIELFQLESREEQIKELITGERFGYTAMHEIVSRWRPIRFASPSRILVTHFEDLIGSQGGGCDLRQQSEILRIAHFLNVDEMSPDRAAEIGQRAYGVGRTFRKGQVGTWRDYFTDEHIELYKRHYGQLLIELGYEEDLQW